MSHAIQIEPDVMDILLRSNVTPTSLALPPEQLDRKLYERVNKVLTALGGKWNRGTKAHLFPNDPRERIAAALESGQAVDLKKSLGVFPTPPEIAERVVAAANIQPGDIVLEPSAGEGALAIPAAKAGGDVWCVEVRKDACETLFGHGLQHVIHDDFLNCTLPNTFDAVVMNPPFGGGIEVDHLLRAWRCVRPNGRLVAILPAGVCFNQAAKFKQLRELVDANYGAFDPLPDNAFRSSGTGVRTVLLTMDRHE